jgi:hypothetical protein
MSGQEPLMTRLRHLRNTLATNWSENQAARGAAKVAAGAVLLAEGLFGVVGRVRGGRQAGGLLGAAVLIVSGVVFLGVGALAGPNPPADEVVTTGRVAEVTTSQNDDGQTMFVPTYAFEHAGVEHRFGGSVQSSSPPTIGATVEIAYSASNPAIARRTDGLEGNLHRVFGGVGVFILLAGILKLMVSLALVAAGLWLLRAGRADRRAAGEDSGKLFDDLFALARRVRDGELEVAATAAGRAGPDEGDGLGALQRLLGAPGSDAPDADGPRVH